MKCISQYANERRKRPDVREKEKLARRQFTISGKSRRYAMEKRATLKGCLQALRAGRRQITLRHLLHLYETQDGKCAITGDPMTLLVGLGREHVSPNNMSIDRVVPALGYVDSNIQLVGRHANMAKWTLSMKELVEFCRKVIRKHGDAYPDT
jgi:hypothetical protein